MLWRAPRADSTAQHATYGSASLAFEGNAAWLAYTERDATGEHVRVFRTAFDASPTSAVSIATFDGTSPSIAMASGFAFIAYSARGPGDTTTVWVRSAAQEWREARPIFRGHDVRLAPGRLTRTRSGMYLLPFYADGQDICLRSQDGHTWSSTSLAGWPLDALEPAIVEDQNGVWIGLARCRSSLVRTTSSDSGRTWSAIDTLATLPRLDIDVPFAVTPIDGAPWVAWAETPPDLALVEPGVWCLRLARITNERPSLITQRPLAWRAGATIGAPALAMTPQGDLAAWISTVTAPARTPLTLAAAQANPQAASRTVAAAIVLRPHPHDNPASVASQDLADLRPAALVATDLWAQHTLGRPQPSRRLFVECYAMRGLIAADMALQPWRNEGQALLVADTAHGIARARAYADSLLDAQDDRGYWMLGYDRRYVADMAVVIGLYAAVEPYLDPPTRARCVESTRRFLGALERDGMLRADGTAGVGWSRAAADHDSLAQQQSYVVSTALAGIAARAWLYRQTRDPSFALAASASLARTLEAIASDGSIPAFSDGVSSEGGHWSATYVHEGWMAADRDLDDDNVTQSLRRALPPHVDWLVRTQNEDGSWGDRKAGEATRTVAITNFLVWYERRCESRDDVRQAIRRAAVSLVDPDRWLESGLLYQGNQEDAQRVLAARSLAALLTGESVR